MYKCLDDIKNIMGVDFLEAFKIKELISYFGKVTFYYIFIFKKLDKHVNRFNRLSLILSQSVM